MLILSILILTLCALIYLHKKAPTYSTSKDAYLFGAAIVACTIFIAVLMVPFQRMQVGAEIQGCTAIEQTLTQSNRADSVKTAYLLKLGSCNADIAEYAYYYKYGFSLWIPKTVNTVIFK